VRVNLDRDHQYYNLSKVNIYLSTLLNEVNLPYFLHLMGLY
jgi:hypothetical protein